MNEYYQQTSDGNDTPAHDRDRPGTRTGTAGSGSSRPPSRMGKDFYGVTYGPPGDTDAMTYGKASFLLDWNGARRRLHLPHHRRLRPHQRRLDDQHRPAGAAKQQVGVGWMRQYTGGIALVDPDPSTPQTFQLPGSYQTSSGSTVTSITLQPTTGAILTATTPVAAPAVVTAPATTTAAAPAPPATTTAPSTPTAPVTTVARTPPTTATTTTPPRSPPRPATTGKW